MAGPDDREWCARLMVSQQPWITLRRDFTSCSATFANPAKECYVVKDADARVGLLILDMTGPFPGYIQSICLVPEMRNRGVGSQVLAWAEARIFRDSPNAFICVSSFNPAAQRLYERLGYQPIGRLKSFVVDEHDELLLCKSQGSWDSFNRKRRGFRE